MPASMGLLPPFKGAHCVSPKWARPAEEVSPEGGRRPGRQRGSLRAADVSFLGVRREPYREPLTLPHHDEDLARDALSSAVEPGERLVWVGRPVQGLRLTSIDWLAIPASLVWGGFALFWEVSAIVNGAPLFFQLWGVPFVAVGVYLILGRFFFDAYRRARTFYGLTDTRALIVVTGATRELVALDLAGQKHIELEETASGFGTIRFGAARRRAPPPPTFEAIPDVRAVHARIRDGQRAASERP